MHFSKDLIRNYSERHQLPANRLKQLSPLPTPRIRPQKPRRPSPTHRPHSISGDMLISSSTVRPHYSSAVNSTVTLIQQQKSPGNRPVDLSSSMTAGIPYSCEHYSSVFCSARSQFTFFSTSNFSGRPHLRLSFHLIPFQLICCFPHSSFRPILLRLRMAPPETDMWTFLLQRLRGFLIFVNITRQFFCSAHSPFTPSQCQTFQDASIFSRPSTSFHFKRYVSFPIHRSVPFCFACKHHPQKPTCGPSFFNS